MSNDRRDNGREKSESGTDRAINSDQSKGHRNTDYSEDRSDRNVVFDTLKPPPRPGRSNNNGDND